MNSLWYEELEQNIFLEKPFPMKQYDRSVPKAFI